MKATGKRPHQHDAPAVELDALRADPVFFTAQAVLVFGIVLVVLAFDPQADDSFALIKSAAAHASAYILLPLLLFLVMRHRAAALPWAWCHIPVLSLLAMSSLSTLLALDQRVGLFGTERRYLGLAQLAAGVLLYFSGVILLRTPQDVRRVAIGIAGATTIVALYALLQSRGFDFVQYKEGVTPIATLGQPDVLGGFLAIAASTAAAFAAIGMGRPAARLLLCGFALVALGAAFTTGTRNGVLGLAGAAVAFVVIVALSPQQRRQRLTALAAAALVALALVALSPVASRLSPDVLAHDPNVIGRTEIWRAALRLVGDRPFLGIGPDNFVAGYPTARREEAAIVDGVGVLQNSPHDWLLFHLLGSGVLGTTAFIATIVFAAWAALRLARASDERALLLIPIGAYLGQGLVNVNDISLEWWYWLPLGALASAVGQPKKFPFNAAPISSAALILAVLLTVGAIAATTQKARIDASEANGVAQSLLAAQRPLEATQSAQRAILLDGSRTRYWMTFGTALAAAGNPSAAANAFQQVIDRQPWNPLAYRNLAFQRLAQGDERLALDALQKAIERDPYDARALDLSARLAYNRDDYERAVRDGSTAVRVAPQLVSVYDAPVNALLKLQQPAVAEELLTRGVQVNRDSHLYVLLAKVRIARNDTAGALLAIDSALAVDPNDPDAKALKAQLKR